MSGNVGGATTTEPGGQEPQKQEQGNLEPQNQESQGQDQGAKPTGEGDSLGEKGKKALDAERKARKDAEKRAADALKRIEEFENSQRSDAEKREHELKKLQSEVASVNQEKDALTRQSLVHKVALKTGLSADLASRLRGDDEDELMADAEELKKFLTPEGPRPMRPVPEEGHVSEPTGSNGQLFESAWNQYFG